MSEFEVSASFAIEATVPGDVAYSSVKARASLGLTTLLTADSEDEARDSALDLLAKVTEDVKLALAANAPGTDYYTDEHGVGQIGINGQAETISQPAPNTAPDFGSGPAVTTPPTNSNGFTPVAHGGDRFTILWNGKQRTVFDNRESKSGNQPDFKMPETREGDEEVALWINTKGGGKNKAALAVQHQIEESVPA